MQYFDKNGTEIKAGMALRMEDGSAELVYAIADQAGNPDLGINASNEAFLRNNYPGCEDSYREYYPLSAFSLRKAEVCQPGPVEMPIEEPKMMLGS